MKRKTRIGFLALDLTNTFNELLLEGVQNRCDEREIDLVVYHGGRLGAPDEIERTQNILYQLICDDELDGLLFSNIFSFSEEKTIQQFFSTLPPLPQVFLIQDIDRGPTIKVRNSTGFRDLVNHLVRQKGCRSIGVITGPNHNADSKERLQVLREVLEENSVPLPEENLFEGTFSMHSGKKGVQTLLVERNLKLDGLVCFNDNMAIGAAQELKNLGMRIPTDIMLTGFDNTRESQNLTPPLTTVTFPMYQLGQKGVDTLMRSIEKLPYLEKAYLETEFIPRRSTGSENGYMTSGSQAGLPPGLSLQGPCESLEEVMGQTKGSWFSRFMEWVFQTFLFAFTPETKGYFMGLFEDLLTHMFQFLKENRPDSLVDIFEDILEEEVVQNRPLDHWDKVLSMLARILGGVLPEGYSQRIYRMVRLTLPQIQRFQRSQLLSYGIRDRFRAQDLYKLGQDLSLAFDRQQIPGTLARNLFSLGIDYCIGVLFNSENPQQLEVFFHIQGEEVILNPSKVFSPKDFYPWLKKQHLHSYLLEALNIGDRAMGFLVFPVKPGRGLAFRLLRHQISSSLMGAMMMKQIQGYATELEAIIKQRTQALEEANKKLVLEMQDRIKMEQTLLKQKNLDSLGILAGGIAHDFNNLLTGILGNVSLLETSTLNQEEVEHCYKDILQAGLHARDLTQQLLTFSKGGAPIKQPVDLNHLVEETARFQLRGSNIKSIFALDEDLPTLKGDLGQLSQVINNIVINAKQVMPQGGTITFECRRICLDEGHPTLEEGSYLCLSIKDTGPGISQEETEKIFDPYYSTKYKGTGLGLATSLAIIRRHKGDIVLESQVGRGASFHIYLPCDDETSMERGLEEIPVETGPKRVLLLEDEPTNQRVFVKFLEFLGHSCFITQDGRQTLAQYRQGLEQGHPYDLVIMDLTIPGGMGGQETVEALIEDHPQALCIVTSGYSDTPVMAHPDEYGFKAILKKPFTLEELQSALNQAFTPEAKTKGDLEPPA